MKIISFRDANGDSFGVVDHRGTSAGTGNSRTPKLWMKTGDTIEVEISAIGTLRNRVVDE